MNKDDLFKVFLINDLMDLPNAVTKILDMDLEDRNKICLLYTSDAADE